MGKLLEALRKAAVSEPGILAKSGTAGEAEKVARIAKAAHPDLSEAQAMIAYLVAHPDVNDHLNGAITREATSVRTVRTAKGDAPGSRSFAFRRIEARASEIQKAEPTLTREQAIAKASEDPDLRRAYAEEQRIA
jgi:hypothetical protein